MDRMRSAGKDFLGAVAVVVVAMALYNGLQNVAVTLPWLESRVSPTVTVEPGEVWRGQDMACFDLGIRKNHNGRPLTYTFHGQTRLSKDAEWGPVLSLAAYAALPGSSVHDPEFEMVPHAVGTQWRRRYCFEMPGTVSDWQELLITGQALHRRHPLFDSVTPMPEFVIPQFKVADSSGRSAPKPGSPVPAMK